MFDVTTRKYTTLLNKEQEKKEIQEGLIKACDVIDLIIEILRGSKNREQVKKCLVEGVTEGIRFKGLLPPARTFPLPEGVLKVPV